MLAAATDILAEAAELFAGSRSILLLTDPEGVVLDIVGDAETLDAGQDIHLMRGGDWGGRSGVEALSGTASRRDDGARVEGVP